MEEDDDDDQISPPPESHSSQDHQMIPPHLQNQRRSSMPPGFPHDRPQGGPEVSPPQPPPRPLDQQPIPVVEKRAPAKSRSIFTPIDESRSLLAQHWGFGTTTNEPAAKNEP